ncbi:MAG TPA: helix-turn-helix domain-containing protein [Myxococcota bacterium]|nr:helix-turn-helix domain-containing protein [Myxococcota bacterium]
MRWRDAEGQVCSVARSLAVVGERWTLLILREAFAGLRRFEDLQAHLGIARNVLAARLQGLVDRGVFERISYQTSPERFEYRLTAKGLELYPVLVALMRWGDRWLDQGEGAPIVLVHKDCGQEALATLTCSHCGKPVDARTMRAVLGAPLRRRADTERAKAAAPAARPQRARRGPPAGKG